MEPPQQNMGSGNEIKMEPDRNTPEYLAQLLKDKKQIQAFPNVFLHVERILDEEINKVRGSLFHFNTNKEPVSLPDASGPVLTHSEKLFVPVKEYPDFNFVGRILGPRGMTAKQLEQDTGCKIMVRGKGSMRDKKKEEMNRGKPNWEHLNEDLHVLITVEDSKNRGELKLKRAVEEVKKLLVPAPEGEDELKKMQLMELAIINGTYRDNKLIPVSSPTAVLNMCWEEYNRAGLNMNMNMNMNMSRGPEHLKGPRAFAPAAFQMPPTMRSPTPAGAPLILAPRLPGQHHHHGAMTAVSAANQMQTHAALMNGAPPPLISPHEAAGLVYTYGDPYAALGAAPLLEYPGGIDQSAAGAVSKMRRTVSLRADPYPRVTLPNI